MQTDLSKLTMDQLLELKESLSYDVSKYKIAQTAKKVQLNSAYGAVGNQHFRFYDTRLAEAVTLSGQLTIQWIASDINKYLNKLLKNDNKNVKDFVIAIDTDSVYLNLNDVVETVCPGKSVKSTIRFLDKFCDQKIQKVIERSTESLYKYMNCFTPFISMKREVLADKGIWTAKKRYILNVWNSEGVDYETPKLKTMGIEVIKSTTPIVCREEMKIILELIMGGTERDVVNHIAAFKKRFYELPPHDIAIPKAVKGLEKYHMFQLGSYTDKTPAHVRGSHIYNHLLKTNRVHTKYQQIQNGDKIRYCYLREPNVAHSNLIAFLDVLPMEFGLHKSIDYATQFQKTFIKPLEVILNAVGWSCVKRTDLTSLFC